jgi:hypothetical protein
MEQLPIHSGNGQAHGHVVYRKQMSNLVDGSRIVVRGHVRDLLMLVINGKMVNDVIIDYIDLVKFGSWGPV